MGIPMFTDLDILGGLTPIKYPPFPPAIKTLAVLAQASICPPTLEDSLPLRYRL
jgi:hypothetical protein